MHPKCVNCGEHVLRYGPETYHVVSTMIACANGEAEAEVKS